MPVHDLGLAIIALTILVRALLLPLSHRASMAQKKMRSINPAISKIKEDFSHDSQEQTKRIMELYQQNGINPFSSCVVFAVQIPIIIALYWVFSRGLAHGIDATSLYRFIPKPGSIHLNFLGVVDLGKPNAFLSLVAAITQYFQIKLSVPPAEPASSGKASLTDDFSQAMNTQMKYIFPVIVFVISFKVSSAIALYWVVTNLFSVAHELVVQEKVILMRRKSRRTA